METNDDLKLEEQIHALLNGAVSDEEREDVWRRIAEDGEARALFDEMLAMQVQARQAFGLAVGLDPRAAGGTWPPTPKPVPTDTTAPKPTKTIRRLFRVALQAAAAFVVAISAYVAVSTYRSNQNLQQKLDRFAQVPKVPGLTSKEMKQFQQVWANVIEDDGSQVPWVLLRNGGGEFGYVTGGKGHDSSSSVLLVRCLLLGPNGQEVRTVNLLLPSRDNLRLSFPQAGYLADKPVRYDIVTDAGMATVGLTVGEEGLATGVRGRTAIGGQMTEIGRFHLSGKDHRLWVQVVPLQTAAG